MRKRSFKQDLLTSVVCTAVFGLIVGTIVACGGGNPVAILGGGGGGNPATALVHVITSRALGSHGGNFAAKDQTQHFAAAFFQTAPAPSALAQPFTRECDLFAIGGSGPSGIIAMVPDGNGRCLAAFQTPDATLIGPLIIRDGTVNTLVVEAQTAIINANGTISVQPGTIECDDLVSASAVLNSTATMAYLDASTSTVNVYSNGTKLQTSCSLHVPVGQVLQHISVAWTKG